MSATYNMRARFVVMVPGLLSFAAACGGGGKGLETPAQCNPLGGANCVAPWPSSIYEVDDASTPTGRRLAIPDGALPVNIDDIAVEPSLFNHRDGFSASAPMITAFATGVDPTNLPHHDDYAASVTAASPTVLVDMSTGELVHHFAELDTRGAGDPAHQAFYIRPAQMLKGGTRYAVAIKRTLKAADGSDLPIPEGFAAILSGEETSHDLLEAVRPRYDAIFTALEAHGVARDSLVTAWDFTTASRASQRADLEAARAAAMPLMGANGANLAYTVDSNAPTGDARIAARIEGTYDAPLFLNNEGNVTPTSALLRDATGKPAPNGMYRSPFTAIVPQCALDAASPVPIMLYGHGLLGDSGQAGSSGPVHVATDPDSCMVIVATDMRGMSDADVPNVALALNDINDGGLIFDTLVQGMMNHVALVQIAKGPMAQALFVDDQGDSIVDPSRVVYYGISQGGIMGGTVCAIDPVIERCVLQVCAINYSMMLERSLDWKTYEQILTGAYPDPLDVALNLGFMQSTWDRTEPTAVADILTGDGFPDTPAKQVLMQIGVADTEVPNVASEYMARTMGIPVLTPSPYVPFGLDETTGPGATSALVIYDFGLGSTIPRDNTAPPENDVHGSIRKRQATVDMIGEFLMNGTIVQTCTAPNGCDCTGDGCGAAL
jgi:hypothetical protein